ncbi:MAG: ECF transporter S component [Clostridiales bacterium]|nr:ECF transporter S component [Clostridiales bacterium]
MQSQTERLVNLALLSSIAYILMAFGRIPVVSFLKYDPKDIVILIGGLIYGPISALVISVLVSFLEMVTVSDTAWIGFWMNVLSTCSFACTASFIYKKKQSLAGAIVGIVCGGILSVIVMLLWNYLLTPIFMNMPREVVIPLLWSVFLPFNVLKAGINGAMTMLIYKPIVTALRKANVIPTSSASQAPSGRKPIGALLVSACVLATCVFFVLVLNGMI